MQRTEIKHLLKTEALSQDVLVKGWVRTFRNTQFIALNDGSTILNVQVVVDFQNTPEEILNKIKTGACLSVKGTLVPSTGAGQSVEVKATEIIILGEADPEAYPIQPKKHSLEFLRSHGHLRMRTNTFSAIFRVRHAMAFAIHQYFHERGYFYIHSPIITGSDAEGAGEMFRVTTLNLDNPPRTEEGKVDFSQDFFGKETNLTVSGQLQGEIAALALGKVYTFGPTFRAENSNTTRHLAEFWMIEPEVAFYEIEDNKNLAEDFLKYLVRYALENCADDIDFLDKRLAEEEKQKPQNDRRAMGLIETLRFCTENDFARISYTEAIQILQNSKQYKEKKFQYEVEWGKDLQSEHERFLVEKHFKKPVIVGDYPKDIKAFYMKLNPDGKTVAAMDVLFPGIGEIIGGSQREDSTEKLMKRMDEMHIPAHEMSWYLDLRRFGSAPHSGFGLGFERLMLFVTGMGNIRDVIGFPRAAKTIEF